MSAKSLAGATLPYRVLLPLDYATSSNHYPVLYLLHGLTGNENDWVTRTRLTEYASRYHLIIIMPGVGDSWYANSATNPNARYEDAIILDLIPYVDSHYRTVATREGRAIAGLSMGGLGAMKFALRYPQLFSFAGSFSGAFDVPLTASLGKKPSARILKELRRIFGDERSQTRRDNDLFEVLHQPLPKNSRFPYLYVSVGKSDPLPEVSSSNPRFSDALRKSKLKYEYYERPGTHDWHFWDSEIEFMLGRLCILMPQICS
ncbi:MAG TPA: alpha/beta hydrolase family protein [Pyrinomonadaceae bacterium]